VSPGSGVSTTVGGAGGAGVGAAWATAIPPPIAAVPSAAISAATILFFRFDIVILSASQPIWLWSQRAHPILWRC
jgi:hypothetical protein